MINTGTVTTSNATSPKHINIAAQSNDHSALLAGVSMEQFFTDAATFIKTQFLVSEYYRLDTPSNFWDVYNVEAEALGQKIVYPPGGIPDADRTTPLISSPSDLDRLHPPDPVKAGRLPWVRKICKMYLEKTDKIDRAYFTAPFSLAVNIRGYENLIDDIFERPKFVHRLLTFLCDEVIVPHVQTLRNELKLPELLMDGRDAWASPPMVTLDMMDEYVVAYTERLREKLGNNVITRGNWGDSESRDIKRFFEQKLRCSPGALGVLDPDLHRIGPKLVQQFAAEHNAFVTAGVDSTLLKAGPVSAIVERIRHYIDILAREGRCMIHLNQIPAETPPAHIHAAVAACHTYGKLPIPEDLDEISIEMPEMEPFGEFMRRKVEANGGSTHNNYP